MSTKEIAYSIIDQLGEEELLGFIALFHRVFPPKTDTDTTDERCAAFERMKNVCRYIPDLDEKSELDEYREEKYGKWGYW